MKGLITISCILLTLSSNSAMAFSVDGKRLRIGDHVSEIYDRWGSPQYRITSDKTCNPYKAKECSYSRLVWERNGRYYMVQEIRSRIIKMKSTSNESLLRKSF